MNPPTCAPSCDCLKPDPDPDERCDMLVVAKGYGCPSAVFYREGRVNCSYQLKNGPRELARLIVRHLGHEWLSTTSLPEASRNTAGESSM